MKKLGKSINPTKETVEAYNICICSCDCDSGCGGASTPATYYASTGIYNNTYYSGYSK